VGWGCGRAERGRGTGEVTKTRKSRVAKKKEKTASEDGKKKLRRNRKTQGSLGGQQTKCSVALGTSGAETLVKQRGLTQGGGELLNQGRGVGDEVQAKILHGDEKKGGGLVKGGTDMAIGRLGWKLTRLTCQAKEKYKKDGLIPTGGGK